jgi:hypothetical protein
MNNFGMRVSLTLDGSPVVFHNVTEVHKGLPANDRFGTRIAFESDIHYTGMCIEESRVTGEMEITLEYHQAPDFQE